MKEWLIILVMGVVILAGGFYGLRQMTLQAKQIEDLRKAADDQLKLTQTAQEAALQAQNTQTIIIRERDRAHEEIEAAVGSDQVVSLDAWRAARGAVVRMREQAGHAPAADRGGEPSQPGPGL